MGSFRPPPPLILLLLFFIGPAAEAGTKADASTSAIASADHVSLMPSGKEGESRIRTSFSGARIPRWAAERRSSFLRVVPRPSAFPTGTKGGLISRLRFVDSEIGGSL